ncbi:Ovule protein [Caenorhabditis elegans]|uniref:Ovule protein n=1 Tax=Caenorhabditis elegans TaxID=6239 RepID=Q93905_CAEEL|nr:Ovule protein [Caenorhabditis elegans]CAB01896.2 Ovule protein [Caenorhabditis elegans]|eukprot:NP_001355364.1 Uncharacterized protein CELE_M163.7 [Caenorhabditis elegans]
MHGIHQLQFSADYDFLNSPFVSTSTISSLNSIQFEVDIEHNVNPSMSRKREELYARSIGYCETVARAVISMFIVVTIFVACSWWSHGNA